MLAAKALYLPASQLTQAAAPLLLHVPAGHARHDATLLAPCVALAVPATQGVQVVVPAALHSPSRQQTPAPPRLYFPTGHKEQDSPLGLYLPDAQFLHMSRDSYFPAPQTRPCASPSQQSSESTSGSTFISAPGETHRIFNKRGRDKVVSQFPVGRGLACLSGPPSEAHTLGYTQSSILHTSRSLSSSSSQESKRPSRALRLARTSRLRSPPSRA